MIGNYTQSIPKSTIDYDESPVFKKETNCIWNPIGDPEPTPIALAGKELNRNRGVSHRQFKKICKKHGACHKRVLKILGWQKLKKGYRINKGGSG